MVFAKSGYTGEKIFFYQKHGHRIYKYDNGDIYEGEFKNCKRNGHGIFKFSNGDFYEGEFKNDKRKDKIGNIDF
jgi:hypothetical protein